MYLEYWGLDKHPFNNVPDPAMYFDMHQSVDDAVGELLFAIEEGDEVLAVVVGPVGAGKTMSLRIVLDSIEPEKYHIAFVTNPDMTFPQLLREIIGQLQGSLCDEKRRDKLLETFNRMLFETSDSGKRILIFIDEGNVIKPHNLESLRLLTNMQDDQRNLFTIVLAGQPELARRLEDPRRANLFQRIGVYCKIQGIDSIETMRDYVEHRMERAGSPPDKQIFSDAAYDALWEFSEQGIPRMVNKICKLSLKAAETNGLEVVDENVVTAVGSRFSRTYSKRLKKSKPAKKAASTVKSEKPAMRPEPKKTQIIQPEKEEKKPTPSVTKNIETEAKIPETPEKAPDPVEKEKKEIPPMPTGTIEIKASAEPTPPQPEEEKAEQNDLSGTKPAEEKHAEEAHEEEHAERTSIRNQILSTSELEELASKLATTKIKEIKQVSDPFEAWETARAQILEQLQKSNEEKKHDSENSKVSSNNG